MFYVPARGEPLALKTTDRDARLSSVWQRPESEKPPVDTLAIAIARAGGRGDVLRKKRGKGKNGEENARTTTRRTRRRRRWGKTGDAGRQLKEAG